VVLDKKEKKRNVERLKAHRIVNSRAVQPITASNISGQNPRQNITRTQNVTKTTTRSQDISSLLEKANAFINKFDYENARILYNQCMVQSGTAVFTNTAARNDAKMMLNHLYLKLAAYRIIYSSRKQANIKSYIALRKNIIELDHVYATLLNNLNYITEEQKDAERKFIDYIYNSKKHLETITS
jgi:transposase-like protein